MKHNILLVCCGVHWAGVSVLDGSQCVCGSEGHTDGRGGREG